MFTDKPLRDLMDIKVFVDTDADTRFIRASFGTLPTAAGRWSR